MLRKMSSSTSSSVYGSNAGNPRGDHVIELQENESRPPARSGNAAPLLEFTRNVISATSHKVNIHGMADSVAAAMHLLPGNQRKTEGYNFEPSSADGLRETQTRQKLLAFWQLLITGFEVLKFSIGKRAKKYVLWLSLDGKLYLGSNKRDKKSARCLFLADIQRIQKGNDAQSFTRSQSWRDARGKDNLTFSIHGRHGKEDRIFGIQVWKPTVRNVLVENFEILVRMMKSDADGEFPYVAQCVIAQHYAATGEILTLRQVEDVLLREEEEHKASDQPDRDVSDDDGSSDGSDASDGGEGEGGQRDILG
ncbi:hypothetical protein Poli38472_003067 [Pythium oligandrum]|uniref:Uncharacterized protein n=1 Tax=Pythium oligandrum TaxID=41045 RepID=A0A8K1C5Y7_PYTOL|nr:hypothetical protein Poli38472_003067 [Pythium oligandrum]|eukprot:TMW57142.1 hypothetical protein Poli38472_003067 [Pythium oligandrum]